MNGLLTSEYDFVLPSELIAQGPPRVRGESRLMVVRRETGSIEHQRFEELAVMIPAGDVLVRNTTRVMRARLLGTRESGARAEILLLKTVGGNRYEAMVRPGGKLKVGRKVRIAEGLEVIVREVTEWQTRIVELVTEMPVNNAIEQYGHVPLPPYIGRGDQPNDTERYQTVYSSEIGSVAAPTAGLHFTEELLRELEGHRVEIADVVLHVGAGTFKPVKVEDPAEHIMHEEWYEVPEEAARMVNKVKKIGGKVWAVGTTSVRTLESAATEDGTVASGSGETSIFIRPPYQWRVVDRLITNFHLPKSTLIMLVAAFAGYELTMRAYREAVEEGYRFFSYGDAMVIL